MWWESGFNERSQEVVENKGHHFITDCNSQEVYENKRVILCKAKRLLMHRGLSVSRGGIEDGFTKILLDIYPSGGGQKNAKRTQEVLYNQ